MEWLPIDEKVLGCEVMGELKAAKRNQDILVKLQYFGYRAETKIVGGVGMPMAKRVERLRKIVVDLQEQLMKAGAYGIVEDQRFYQPKPKMKPEEPKPVPTHWAVLPSSTGD